MKRKEPSSPCSTTEPKKQKEETSDLLVLVEDEDEPSLPPSQQPSTIINSPFKQRRSHIINEGNVCVSCIEGFLCPSFCKQLTRQLLEKSTWTKDTYRIHGKLVDSPRTVCAYSDNGRVYSYSGMSRSSVEWFPELLALKQAVEMETGELFNYALVNRYENGNEYIGWHSDKVCYILIKQ